MIGTRSKTVGDFEIIVGAVEVPDGDINHPREWQAMCAIFDERSEKLTTLEKAFYSMDQEIALRFAMEHGEAYVRGRMEGL